MKIKFVIGAFIFSLSLFLGSCTKDNVSIPTENSSKQELVTTANEANQANSLELRSVQTIKTDLDKLIASMGYKALPIPKKFTSPLSIATVSKSQVKQLTINFKGGRSMLIVIDLKGKVLYYGYNSDLINSGVILANLADFLACAERYFVDYGNHDITLTNAALGVLGCAASHLNLN